MIASQIADVGLLSWLEHCICLHILELDAWIGQIKTINNNFLSIQSYWLYTNSYTC